MDVNCNFTAKMERKNSMPKMSKKTINELLKAKGVVQNNRKQVNFGICFDVDGVLARGTRALPPTQKAFDLLKDESGQFRVPVCFVTNALNRNQDKAAQIAGWIGTEVSPEQMVQCQGPLEVFTKYHSKHCLIVGQGKIHDIATELGFTNFCTLDEIVDSYPLLDVVDHDNRKRNAAGGYEEKEFPRVEAIVLLGEPKKWDQALQVLVDLLVTDGKPDKAPETYPEVHLPILACNMDLQFMDLACMPRYGHGAFLLCLEALYLKVSGRELKYTSLIGKPSEITFRYAEHCITREARKLGINEPIKRMYLIGDTPDSDIVGSNLYQRHVHRLRTGVSNSDVIDNVEDGKKSSELYDPELPASRNTPLDARLSEQTVEEIKGILVCTGVYKPGSDEYSLVDDEKHNKGHRDFPITSELYKPFKIKDDVHKAVEFILDRENVV